MHANNDKKQSLQSKISVPLGNKDELVKKLKDAQNINKEKYKVNLSLVKNIKDLQHSQQSEEQTRIALVEIINLLKDQMHFERLSRKCQQRIEFVEDTQRFCEDSYKETLAALAQLEKESNSKNEDLHQRLSNFHSNLLHQIHTKESLHNEIKLVMAKVCNRAPSELKIDQVESNFKKLNSFENAIVDIENDSEKSKRIMEDIRGFMYEYVNLMKKKMFDEAEEVISENQRIIDNISLRSKHNAELISKLESQLRDKSFQYLDSQSEILEIVRLSIAQAKAQTIDTKRELDEEKSTLLECKDRQDYNHDNLVTKYMVKESLTNPQTDVSVVEFVNQNVECQEQNQRLKQMLEDRIGGIENSIKKIEEHILRFEENIVENKIGECQNLVVNGKEICSVLEQNIDQLEDKLSILEANAEKATEEDRKEILEEIQATTSKLESLKYQKEKLKKDIETIAKNEGEDIILHQQELKDIVKELEYLNAQCVKEHDKDCEEIEGKVRNAIRKIRNEKRKDCLDHLESAKATLATLLHTIDTASHKISSINTQVSKLKSQNSMRDLEMDQDISSHLKSRLDDQMFKFNNMQEQKENLVEIIEILEKQIEQVNQEQIGWPTLESRGKEFGVVNKDHVVEQWEKCLNKSKELSRNISSELIKGNSIHEEVDTVKQVAEELHQKYSHKNQILSECTQKKTQNDEKLQKNEEDLDKIEDKLKVVQELMKKVQLPEGLGKEMFEAKMKERMRGIELMQEKMKQIKSKQKDQNDKHDDAVKDLRLLGEKVVSVKQLKECKDDLDKMNLEIGYLNEDIKGFDWECEELIASTQSFLELNKKLKEEEAESKLKDLQEQIKEIDKIYTKTLQQNDEYQKLIKEGLRVNNEDVQQQMRLIQQEGIQVESDIKKLEKLRNNLKAQEQIFREKVVELKNDSKISAIQELDKICQGLNTAIHNGDSLSTSISSTSDSLSSKIDELQQFLQKYDELTTMNNEFELMMKDIKKNYVGLIRKIAEGEELCEKLRPVLEAMGKGVKSDYRLKEGLINSQRQELDEVVLSFAKLQELKDNIEPKILEIENDPNDTLNIDQLQNLISTVSEILDKIDKSEHNASQCMSRLFKIRETVYSASIVPELIQIREKEIQEYAGKLRKIESDFQDLKRNMIGKKNVDNYAQINEEMKDLDRQLQKFREKRVIFKRILGQELQIFLPNPQVLEDLDILKETIIKVIELGFDTNEALENLDKIQMATIKLKRQLEGLDLYKRHADLNQQEGDQRNRLIEIKKKLERIQKGASDCDGYTSNTEEATFIDTLLNEMPEMLTKQKEAFEECNQISDSLVDMQNDVKSAQDHADDEEFSVKVSENLELYSLEEQLGLNEKTVVFLEKLVDKLEDHFMQMDVKKKLEKRQLELEELANICEDFESQLSDMHSNVAADLRALDEKRDDQGQRDIILSDEDGNQVSLVEEFNHIKNELNQILEAVVELQFKNQEVQSRQQAAFEEFQTQVLKHSPFKRTQKIQSKSDVFQLLRANGWMKKKIIEMIKNLKEISRKMRAQKQLYREAKMRIERGKMERKRYKAVKGDIVDELLADYINKLNCPVPIARLGNNYYTFGTKKIFAKIINGKLVIRVGGGYMGIEEFMMYYGQQELQRIQKQEYLASLDAEGGEDQFSDEEEYGKRSSRVSQATLDIDRLKKRLRQNSARKSLNRSAAKSFVEDEEHKQDNQGATVLGLGDIRQALRQNLVEIKTYQDHSSISHFETAQEVAAKNKVILQHQKVGAESAQVEKQLRSIERNVVSPKGVRNVGGLKGKQSPRRPGSKASKDLNTSMMSQSSHNSKSNKSMATIDQSLDTSKHETPPIQQRFLSRIPQIRKNK